MEKKMTYVDAINFVLSVINENQFVGIDEELAMATDKLESLKEFIAKRNSHKSTKPTKTQRENEGLKIDIFNFIAENDAKRAMDVAGYFGITIQKASALLAQLVKVGSLKRITEKKVTYFRAVEGV